MLHVLLLILKIIGIVILAILALLVLLLLVVLLVPLRYRLSGSGSGDLQSLQGSMKFSWLLHLVSGYVTCRNQKVDWNVRIAWKWLGEKAQSKSSEENSESEEEYQKLLEELEQETEIPSVEKPVVMQEAVEKVPIQENVEKQDITDIPHTKEPQVVTEPKKTKKPQKSQGESYRAESEKKSSFIEKVKAFFEKIKYTFQRICDNIKSLMATKEKLEDFVTNEVHQAALQRGIRELKRLLRFLKPKRFRLNAHIGFSDPSVTGKMLAGLSILYPFVGKNHLCVTPEFEEEIYEGDIMIRGHLRVIYIIIIGWNLIWDKNIRMTYKHIKNYKK